MAHQDEQTDEAQMAKDLAAMKSRAEGAEKRERALLDSNQFQREAAVEAVGLRKQLKGAEDEIKALKDRLSLYEGSSGVVSSTGLLDDLVGQVDFMRKTKQES